MLFHATHTHSYQTCHAHDDQRKGKMTEALQAVDEIGINIISILVDPPGHKFYFIIEADSMEQIVRFFDPMLELGDADIHPVMEFKKALNTLNK